LRSAAASSARDETDKHLPLDAVTEDKQFLAYAVSIAGEQL
jgi:hypothetical protein